MSDDKLLTSAFVLALACSEKSPQFVQALWWNRPVTKTVVKIVLNGTEVDMNWDRIEGNWEQFKGKVQEQWGKLTADDLDVIEGNRKQLVGRLQERYGKTKEEIESDVDNWLAQN